MNTFVLEIFDNSGSKCTFYTVHQDEHEYSETDKFFLKFEKKKKFKRSVLELASFINLISTKHGAKSYFFKFENKAQALPPSRKYKIDEVVINYKKFPSRP